jgi:uncharacterized protein YjbI with pentapeptide repeats
MMVGQQVEAMANPEHLAKLKEGTQTWNQWRSAPRGAVASGDLIERLTRSFEPVTLIPDLSGANLAGIDANGMFLSRAKLDGTILDGADLRSATLSEASLLNVSAAKTDFSKADLRGVKAAGAPN